MEYVSMVSELNYMSQIVVMLYEDPTKDPSSEERFHVELHFSPGVNCCVQKNLPPGPGFRPHSRNESSQNIGESGGSGQDTISQCSARIEEEDTELGILEDEVASPPPHSDTPPPLMETDAVDSMMDSPTTSRAIDMMDLDPNMMDEPFDSGFLQSSAPIPISARTVAGHEAARLGSQLAASQRQRRDADSGGIVEPRARSYDHQRQEKPEKDGPTSTAKHCENRSANLSDFESECRNEFAENTRLDTAKTHGPTVFPGEEDVEEPEEEGQEYLSVPEKPAVLSHSFSSPELPVPVGGSCSSKPLVTLHSTPLASPSSKLSPPWGCSPTGVPDTEIDPRPECRKGQGKKYGRSHSEMILPFIEATARRHRHSISGQMSYFKLLGYNVSKKLTGSANSLFSTAVISGSSSAPNLKDMVPPHASAVAAIEGFGGVPPIRPLETLHNALSLRQLDSFLEMMTSAPLFRTPASSPPKYPSPGGSTHEAVNQNLSIGGISREYHSADLEAVRYITPTPIQYKSSTDGEVCDIRNQPSPTSPNSTGWSSEPQSFLSSEPSSPAPTSTGECSMSISLISNDGAQPFTAGAPKFSTTPCLDMDFSEFCMNIEQEGNREGRGSISYTDYYSNEDGQIRKCGLPSGFDSNLQTVMRTEDLPLDNEDDEEHTLTLKRAEEQKKQDVKLIFEQKETTSAAQTGGNYKKIGRFRVESMEIADEDVRFKETDPSPCPSSADKPKSQKSEYFTLEKQGSKTDLNLEKQPLKTGEKQDPKRSSCSFKRKNFARSQSVSTPKPTVPKLETNFSYKCTSRLSSFSTMSDKDLEEWKRSVTEDKTGNGKEAQAEEPILTVAASLTDGSNVTVGFNVQENVQEKKD